MIKNVLYFRLILPNLCLRAYRSLFKVFLFLIQTMWKWHRNWRTFFGVFGRFLSCTQSWTQRHCWSRRLWNRRGGNVDSQKILQIILLWKRKEVTIQNLQLAFSLQRERAQFKWQTKKKSQCLSQSSKDYLHFIFYNPSNTSNHLKRFLKILNKKTHILIQA